MKLSNYHVEVVKSIRYVVGNSDKIRLCEDIKFKKMKKL